MKKLIAVLLLAACACCLQAQAPTDVPQGHWAYQAVSELAGRGLIQGYPDGKFLGNRTLTRYEFATVVKRILDEVDGKIAAVANKAGEAPAATAPATTTATSQQLAASGISKEDLDNISKLVEEFKVELTVIGTRLDKVEADIAELQGKVSTIDAVVNDPEGTVQTLKDDVGGLKKITVGGFIQARYNVQRGSFNSGSATTQGLDNFSTRRARVKVTANPTASSSAVIQFDAGQNAAGNNTNTVTLKDAYLEYYFAKNPALGLNMSLGQMVVPFGYEVPQSDTTREAPERSLIVQRVFPNERDKGFKLFSATGGKLLWNLGVFQGTGINNPDVDNKKDVMGSAKYKSKMFDLGVSAYYGKGINNGATGPTGTVALLPGGANAVKSRYGVDLEAYPMNNLTFKGEFISAKGIDGSVSSFDLNQKVSGYFGQLAYNFMPSYTAVAKYESITTDPLYPQYGHRTTWNLGLLKWLDEKSQVKFFYQMNGEQFKSFKNDAYLVEWITSY